MCFNWPKNNSLHGCTYARMLTTFKKKEKRKKNTINLHVWKESKHYFPSTVSIWTKENFNWIVFFFLQSEVKGKCNIRIVKRKKREKEKCMDKASFCWFGNDQSSEFKGSGNACSLWLLQAFVGCQSLSCKFCNTVGRGIQF